MKTSERYIMGSRYFFDNYYDDFKPHDNDYFCWCYDDSDLKFETQINLRGQGLDCFIWKQFTPEWFIDYHKNKCKLPMEIGKFLIPEICNSIGFTLDHLKQLENCFDNLDEKHTYEKIIFQSYIENNSMTLTKEQRDKAYEEYKRVR